MDHRARKQAASADFRSRLRPHRTFRRTLRPTRGVLPCSWIGSPGIAAQEVVNLVVSLEVTSLCPPRRSRRFPTARLIAPGLLWEASTIDLRRRPPRPCPLADGAMFP